MPTNGQTARRQRDAGGDSDDDVLRMVQLLLAVARSPGQGVVRRNGGDVTVTIPLKAGHVQRIVQMGFLRDHPSGDGLALTRDGLILSALAMRLFRSQIDERVRIVPCWNPLTRVLSFDGRELKQFRRAAPNQERLLAEFEMLGWPDRILDPLPDENGVVAKVRLRETIKQLNRTIDTSVLRFSGDGTGCGVCWHLTGKPMSPPEKNRRSPQVSPRRMEIFG